MRKIIIAASFSLIASSAMSADERTAANIVKKYSETIACQIQEVQYQKNQYKAVKIIQGDKELGGLGDLFVVYWEGDVGCMGGNGTVVPNFTVVEQRGFSSVPPVVIKTFFTLHLNPLVYNSRLHTILKLIHPIYYLLFESISHMFLFEVLSAVHLSYFLIS